MTHRNNFDALRLFGASVVIVGHAYHLLGRGEQVPFLLGFPIQTFGVVVFFSISGFLITASWSRGRDLRTYFAARCLRIFPALTVVVLATTFVLGPALSTLGVGSYLADGGTWAYLKNIALSPVYELSGVFAALPYPNAVNGSLWTLPAEFFCYVAVPLLLMLGGRRFAPVTVGAALGASLWLAHVPAAESPVIYGTRLADASLMWTFFAAGALIRLATERWSGFVRSDVAAGLTLLHLMMLSVRGEWTSWVSWLTLPYVVLAVGLACTPYVSRAARFGDFSYGLYLWAFPVQQLVVSALGVVPMVLNVALVGGISLILAIASWHLVEEPAMRLRHRVGRSGRRAAEAGNAPDDGVREPAPVN